MATRPDPALEGLIGTFLNTLVHRNDVSGDPSFNELVERVWSTSQDALAYQDVWFSPDMSIITLDVPVAYVAPGSAEGEYRDLLLSIQYDVAADLLAAWFFAFDEAGAWLGWQMLPLIVILSETGLWADPELLTFEYVPVPTGVEVYSELTVFDYGGNSDFAAVSVTVP